MRLLLRFVWRIARRRPWITAAAIAAIMFVLLVVPIEPFYPRCDKHFGDPTGLVTEPLTPEFRHVAKYGLKMSRMYYWEIGGQIWIRYLLYFDSGGRQKRINDIANTSFQAVNALINPNYGLEGELINGKPYKIPDHIRALYDVKKSRYPYNPWDCVLMRAVATGKPIETTEIRN